ncbi:hypothetical protein BCR43DRAFT_237501 [Syncephalastrum racemosum]|uniref:Tetratricopeptide SHNi-TPR domain-containing protein n=1 Tax=Syncephalastrum racemosum TaxID=13706 RepID=A0A1X2HEM0_SYNRA|nr:hypothetical protein BCR43DRAFT_237501 [Syncephalastrum racemosum]
MALEEEQKKEKNDDIVRRLFDMALDRYQDKEKEDRLGYAICLLQVGRHLSVEESLKESLDVLRALVRNDDAAWIYLGQAATELLLFLRKRQNTRFEEALAELDEEDEEDQVVREELTAKQKLSREEKKLYKEAMDALEKATSASSSQVRSVLYALTTYTTLLEQPLHQEDIASILKPVRARLDQLETDADLLCLKAECHLSGQRFLESDQSKEIECRAAVKAVQEAKKLRAENEESARDWELLAKAQIELSNFVDDEDEVIELVDSALESYKKALELDPENEDVKVMVEMLAEPAD